MLREFRCGALRHSRAEVAVAVAVTGAANFSGGTVAKPVGTVWFGWATPLGVFSETRRFGGDRRQVRQATVCYALERLVSLLK